MKLIWTETRVNSVYLNLLSKCVLGPHNRPTERSVYKQTGLIANKSTFVRRHRRDARSKVYIAVVSHSERDDPNYSITRR